MFGSPPLHDDRLAFETIVDPNDPDAVCEDTADHLDEPGGVNGCGERAEGFEVDPDGRWTRFERREGSCPTGATNSPPRT